MPDGEIRRDEPIVPRKAPDIPNIPKDVPPHVRKRMEEWIRRRIPGSIRPPHGEGDAEIPVYENQAGVRAEVLDVLEN